ncbi:MAG: hypothetical protein IJJ57_05755, partial [Ruminococcus sp.]|nr:hypothetical protein [Ruminococcus sp.]
MVKAHVSYTQAHFDALVLSVRRRSRKSDIMYGIIMLLSVIVCAASAVRAVVHNIPLTLKMRVAFFVIAVCVVLYIGGGLYEAAANTALLKMISPIPTDPSLSKKQNVAFLFDVTDSMDVLLKKYRAEALRAIKRVFDAGGSVALYTYGDL